MSHHIFSVLLIDDDATTANLFDLVMSHHEVALTWAQDAQTAFDYLQQQTPDAIVIDIFMPGLDGYRTLDSIRREHLADSAVCVATTSYHNSDTPATLSQHGFDGYLP